MNFWKKCPLLILLAVSGLLITIVGAANRNGVYSGYEKKTVMTPILAVVFEGIKEKTYPWQESAAQETAQRPEETGPVQEMEEAWAKLETDETGAEEKPEGLDEETALEMSQENREPAQDESGELTEPYLEETFGQEAVSDMPDGGSEGDGARLQAEAEDARPEAEADGAQLQAEADDARVPAGTDSAEQAQQDGGGAADGQKAQTDEGQPERWDRMFAIGQVSEDYFEDALFIGDSRTQGLYEYGGFGENVTFYCRTSLTIYDLFKKEKAFIRTDGGNITLEQALTERSFGKIYLMIGINELGTGTPESFFEEYARAVYRIRQLQPDAVIFVQAIMKVGAKKSASDPIFNNLNIAVRNVEIQTLADDKTVFYIDVNEVLCDENGNLFEGWSNDQIHLKAKYYAVWKEFLMNHGAVEIVEN